MTSGEADFAFLPSIFAMTWTVVYCSGMLMFAGPEAEYMIQRSDIVSMSEIPRHMHTTPLQLLEEVVVGQGPNMLVTALEGYVIQVELMCICDQR